MKWESSPRRVSHIRHICVNLVASWNVGGICSDAWPSAREAVEMIWRENLKTTTPGPGRQLCMFVCVFPVFVFYPCLIQESPVNKDHASENEIVTCPLSFPNEWGPSGFQFWGPIEWVLLYDRCTVKFLTFIMEALWKQKELGLNPLSLSLFEYSHLQWLSNHIVFRHSRCRFSGILEGYGILVFWAFYIYSYLFLGTIMHNPCSSSFSNRIFTWGNSLPAFNGSVSSCCPPKCPCSLSPSQCSFRCLLNYDSLHPK